MCYMAAIPIAMAVISAATTAYSINQQNKTSRRQAEAAEAAAQTDQNRLASQAAQQNDKFAREKLQRQMQTQRERARIRVAQGESGIAGQSSLAVLNNSLMQGSYDVSTLEANRTDAIGQVGFEQEAITGRAKARIDNANANFTGAGMSSLLIGGAGAQGYLSGSGMTSGLGGGSSSASTPYIPAQ